MRPPEQTPEAVTRDILDLERVLRRAQASKRTERERVALEGHLRAAIAILHGFGESQIPRERRRAG